MFECIYEPHTPKAQDLYSIFHNVKVTPTHQHSEKHMHWHESLEIIYILEGTCSLTCGPNTFLAHERDLVIIHCNESHKVQMTSTYGHYYCLIVNHLDYQSLGLPVETMRFQRIIHDSNISDSIIKIADEVKEHSTLFRPTIKSLINYLILQLVRNHVTKDEILPTASPSTPKHQLVQQAILYIQSNFTHSLTLEEICLHIGVTKYYFCRIFKDITGKTAIEFINEYKCLYAQKLLTEGLCSIEEISEQCGFNSIPYFYRIYKKYMGTTPSTLKSSSKNKLTTNT